MIGFCWGCNPTFLACETNPNRRVFDAGVMYHPSLQVLAMIGSDAIKVSENVKVPMRMGITKQEDENYRVGGGIYENLKKNLGDKFEFQDYADQNHGFVPRVDLKKCKDRKAVKDAMTKAVAFFKKHL